MQIQSTNESLKDPPMFGNPGGGGKGIRPNQHSQQQQQQQQQQGQQQQHHQPHHQTHHQSHQPQQVQLQTASIHHSNQQTSGQATGGTSHSHPHQLQTAAPPPHQQAYTTHPQVPFLYHYPIHPQALSSTGPHHPGQSTNSNVGGAQLAPSPPTHTAGSGGGNGAQGGGGAGGNGAGAVAANNASGNANTNIGAGVGGRQGQGTHYQPAGTIIQTNLQPPAGNPFMTQSFQVPIPQHNTVMMYNGALTAAAAAGQHCTPTAGHTGPLYQTATQAQTNAAHQQATLHGHYFANQTVAAQAPTSLHNAQQIRNMTVLPHHRFYYMQMPPGTRISNAHQHSATGSGNSTVHVGAPLQNTGTRGVSAGPYVQSQYCAPPLQLGATTGLATQAPSLMTATGISGPPLANAYSHLAGSTGAPGTSSTPLNLAAGSGSIGLAAAAPVADLTKKRSKAVPIIDPATMEEIRFEQQNKSSSSAALEIKPPPEAENRPAKTTTITMTAPPPETTKGSNDKTTTATAAAAASAATTTTAATTTPHDNKVVVETSGDGGTTPASDAAGKDKIDQQMQTEPAAKSAAAVESSVVVDPVAAATAVQPSVTGEENDDTDAETPELEHDDDDGAGVVPATVPEPTKQQVEQKTKQPETTAAAITAKDSTETETTTNTDVTPVAQMEDDAGVKSNNNKQQQQQQPVKGNVVVVEYQMKQSSPIETNKNSNNKQQQHHQSQGKMPPSSTTTTQQSTTTKDATNRSTEDPTTTAIPNKKKDVATSEEIVTTTATNKELNISTQKTTTTTAATSKDQQQQGKTTTTTNTKMGANTTTTPSISNVKKGEATSKASNNNPSAAVTAPAAVAATAATNALDAANNDDSFITQQQQHQQRTKDQNQKKSQQQRPQHERSNSTASNASSSNNNKSSSVPSTNNNNSKQAPQRQQSSSTAAAVATKEPQTTSTTTAAASTTNNNNNVDNSKTTGVETKDNDKPTAAAAVPTTTGKHVKSQEIVEQFIQPSVAAKSSAAAPAADTKGETEQIQFLNSSSSACEEEVVKKLTETSTKSITDNEATAIKDVRFGDFKDDEKVKEATVATKPTASSKTETTAANTSSGAAAAATPAAAAADSKTPDMVDSTNTQSHARPAVAAAASTTTSKSAAKILHVAPSIQKHPKTGKSLYRYSLDELKQLAKSEESQKLPVVPCQKGGCIAALFVSRPNNQNLPHMQQQYQHMNFNESMDLVSGKRGGRPQRKHDHNMTGSCGNIAGAGGPPGPGGSMVGTTGGSVSVTGTSFARPRMIRVNLSLNEEIKLNESENAWKPETLRKKTGGGAGSNSDSSNNLNDNIEAVLKKVRGVLNKLTPENFEVLLKTMVSISLDTTEKMQQVMLLIFEKTISEPNFAPTYAKFCKVLFQEVKPESKQLFNTLLIKRIQTEFETNVNNADAKNEKLKPLIEKLEACTDPKERQELQAELEDQEYQFRRRAWGTVRFIGEMFKLQSLTGDRVMMCIESLLEHGSEEKLEYMCKLMTTVGHLLEAKYSAEKNITRMDRVFNRINDIIKQSRSQKDNHNKISSRVRFMMQDVVDLRARRWDQTSSPSTAQSGPASVSSGGSSSMSGNSGSQHQNRRGNRDDKNSRNNYDRGGSSQRMGGGGRGDYGNNNQGRRMDNRDNYYNKNSQKGQYQQDQSLDFKKLNFSRGLESESSTKLGNSSLFMWRTTGRSQQGGLLQNATAPPFGGSGMSSSGSQHYSGSSSQSNSANNTMKRPTNPFQVLSTRESDNDRHQNSDVERPSASHTSASSSSNEGSDDEDEKSVVSYSATEVRKTINLLVEEYLECDHSNSFAWQAVVLDKWRSHTLKQHMELLHCLLMDYLHLRDVSRDHRAAAAAIFSYLLKTKSFDKKTFGRAYDQFAEEFADVLVDVPNGWTYVFEFLGPLLYDGMLTFNDVWRSDWKDDFHFTQKFVKALIVYFTKEFGTNYVRDVWHKEFKLDRGQIFTSDQKKWQDFISSNQLQYIYDANVKPPSDYTSCAGLTVDKKVKRLATLLKGQRDNCDLAIDYINTNVNINDEFLRQFARFLCCDYATVLAATTSSSSSTKKDSSSSAKTPQVNAEKFRKICVPMLRLCIDAQEKYELACLDAVHDGLQYEYSDYAAVDDITCNIFDLLYDSEVIPKESLDKWYRQRIASSSSGGSEASKSKSRQQQQQLSAKFQAYLQKML
ncbi:eukaryotic translation initiation factor 4 gamma 1 [Musca vetustissima]|uniref:eukaryotic translation initiation factor 4 gamma 1 n=1 Tax=Musca vetustissima TaxID=27455 RepID=UPI002AB5F138|nr:eukaryotic translation initiation factor 4 gamma 1 [Musca vetustissima]